GRGDRAGLSPDRRRERRMSGAGAANRNTGASPMPRLLLVMAAPPHAEGGAAARCALARLHGLRAHGVEVVAVAARQVFSPPGLPPADLDVEVIEVAPPAPGWGGRLERLRRPRGHLGA